MGKVSPNDEESKASKRKKRLRSSGNKYLKPGTLLQLRYSKTSAGRSCADLGKKRVAIADTKKTKSDDISSGHRAPPMSPLLSPVGCVKQSSLVRKMDTYDLEVEDKANKSPLILSPMDIVMQSPLVRTPKTPQADPCNSESRLESLPMDLLVKVVCHLHHDQLKAVFHVSQRIRRAALFAKQYHFNYTTPDRSRQELLSSMTPRPIDHWPFSSKGDGNPAFMPNPRTPKAPRHGPRPPSRIKATEMKQIAAVLFQDQTFPSRCMVPSVLQKPQCKSLASNRVLFYEDELCQAVAQNKLR